MNLEDGRKTLDPKTKLAKKYGAALVALTIDEKGQADTAEWKFEVAKRIYDIVVNEYGIPPSDLLFDPLVLPVTTGQEQTRKSAMETFEGTRLIKQNCPACHTLVGLSNCSFGLEPVHAGRCSTAFTCITRWNTASTRRSCTRPRSCRSRAIDETGKELCRRLLFDERVFDAAGTALKTRCNC